MVSQQAVSSRSNSLGIALGVFVLWVLFVVGGQKLFFPNVTNVDDLVKSQINPIFVTAVVLLLGVTIFFRWQRPVGLKAAKPPLSWLVLWLPAVFILLFLGSAAVFGLPPASVLLFVLINTLLVGVHEELMCRGILFQGLLSRLSIWQAILLTSVMFGSVHALNGFLTGNFVGALFQAGGTVMSGLWLLAVRLRTRSLYPAMVIHGLWDFALLVVALSSTQGAAAPSTGNPAFVLLLNLPLMLYGLWLLRGIGKKTKDEVLA